MKHIDLEINYFEDYNKKLLKRLISFNRKQKIHKEKLEEFLNKIEADVVISVGTDEKNFLPYIHKKSKKIREFHFGKNYRIQTANAFNKNFILKIKAYLETYFQEYYLKKYDKVIVLTYEDLKKWKLKNIDVIYNFTSIVFEEKAELTNKKIISVGRIDPQKGYNLLVEAWKYVIEENSGWSLDIVGDGSDFLYIKEKIKKLGLEGSINLKGATPNIKEEYLNASMYVMSSKYEGFPLVLLEAATCGLPLVSFKCESGPADIIKDGETGFLVKENDVLELASKISLLAKDDKMRKKFGEVGRKDSKERFNKEKIMHQWINLFEKLSIGK